MYKTAKELHIGIDLGLQRINSDSKQTIKAQEKDWVLNEVMFQIINQVSNPNSRVSRDYFENDQKAIDMLESLKVFDGNVLPVFKSNSLLKSAYVELPKNYLKRVSVKALIVKGDVEYSDPEREVVAYKVFMPDATALSDYTANFKISIGGTDIFNISNQIEATNVYKYAEFNNNESRYLVIREAIDAINNLDGYSAYWSKHGNIAQDNSFIIIVDTIVADITPTVACNLTLGGTVIEAGASAYYAYHDEYDSFQVKTCRIIRSDDENDVNDHYYAKSDYDSPTITIGNNSIKVNVPDGCTVAGLIPIYLRKPRLINIINNVGCEINSSDFHNELVNKTVQKIAARIEDKSYPNHINENLLLE